MMDDIKYFVYALILGYGIGLFHMIFPRKKG